MPAATATRTAPGKFTLLGLLGLFLVVAFVLRAPSYLYAVIDWDESLYLLIGAQLNEGVLPYTGLWDRKPFGTFLLFAGFERFFADGILAMRLAASVAMGVSAYLVYRLAGMLFTADGERIGLIAGILVIVASIGNGGMASNTEMFFIPCTLLGAVLALRALGDSSHGGYARGALAFLAGSAFGVGLLIKYIVIFDIVGLAIAYVILASDRPLAPLRVAWRALPLGIIMAIGALLPSLAVMGLYLVNNEIEAFLFSNLYSYIGFAEINARPLINLGPIMIGVVDHLPLWLGTAAAALGIRVLSHNAAEVRTVLALLIWTAFVALGIVFLRFYYDHYFLQLMPPLALLTGFAVTRGLLATWSRPHAWLAISLLAVVTTMAISKETWLHSFFIAKNRYVDGETWAGDLPRQIAADLAPRLAPGETIYVYNYEPILYYLTATEPPTRFPFPPHILQTSGYGLIDSEDELQRILATQPRFIILREDTFNPPSYITNDPRLTGIIAGALETNYRLLDNYEAHPISRLHLFSRLMKPVDVRVYERRVAGGQQVSQAFLAKDSVH